MNEFFRHLVSSFERILHSKIEYDITVQNK